jgi:hypothetical protein
VRAFLSRESRSPSALRASKRGRVFPLGSRTYDTLESVASDHDGVDIDSLSHEVADEAAGKSAVSGN